MDKMLFIAMNGAKHVALQQATTSNNLANANTDGFKAELVAFRALPVVGDGTPTRAYTVDSTVGHDPTEGPVSYTNNPQDFALNGHGFFAVQDRNGNEAYTRKGGYVVDQNGIMRTRDGLPILDDGGAPITIPFGAQVEIGTDGSIIAILSEGGGKGPQDVSTDAGVKHDVVYTPPGPQIIGRIKLVGDPSGREFFKGTDGLFRRHDGTVPPMDETRRVQPRAVEGSNVNPVEALVQMVNHARQFDLNIKMMQTADQNARQANSIMSLTN